MNEDRPVKRCALGACGLFVLAGSVRANAAFLPAELTPPAPFPLVLTQSLEREYVAPGVERAAYHLQTSAGPLVVSLVAFDPREPTLRIGTVLARDHIVSTGETVSSMAARTAAVAGINADYFDIGNTNTPLGIVAQNGALVRTPGSRPAFTVGSDRTIRYQAVGFHGAAIVNGTTPISLTAVNEWPPHDGATLLTPLYGIPPPNADCVLAELTRTAGPSAAAAPAGRYRVTRIDLGTAPLQATYALALGPAARRGLTTLPDVGDLIDVSLVTEPAQDALMQAAGGGPALLTGGTPVDDPASPGYTERARRIPAAAAATFRDGDNAFIVVDGHHPALSIGVNRAELIALLTGLGAVDALQFDSGGSATLVARVLGDSHATVQNDPSDGIERPVADGLFLYSDNPPGPPARLVVRPSTIVALPDTALALRSAIVDAAGNPLGLAHGPWQLTGNGARIDDAGVLHTGLTPLTTTLQIVRAGVRALVPLDILAAPTKIAIGPDRPDIDPNATLALHARAFDERGREIETGDRVRWSALRGSVTPSGVFTAAATDGFVTAAIGDTKSSEIIHVGRHRSPLAGFDPLREPVWRFSTVPAGGPGSLALTPQATLDIAYDFRETERAAYANAGFAVGEPLGFACTIVGDGGGAGVRLALLDRYGERAALTLAKSVDWTGAQRREIRVPPALAPPLVLQSLYVVGSLGSAPVKSAGTIGIRDCTVTLPGSAAAPP